MSGETKLKILIQEMAPVLNKGEFVFTSLKDLSKIKREDIIFEFKEAEGITIILNKEKADILNLNYNYIASWITLKVYSSLEAIGLTAVISSELAKNNISCNVIAGYYHDHIFVTKKDAVKAIKTLKELSKNYS